VLVSTVPLVGCKTRQRGTYYGMEHRGHLYLPGCAPHTPQSLGSGFFGGDDGSASEPKSEPGFATGSALRGAVRSGETAPSNADRSAGLPSSAAGMAQMPLVPFWPGIIALLRLINREIGKGPQIFVSTGARC
jgi:hypothetical protein